MTGDKKHLVEYRADSSSLFSSIVDPLEAKKAVLLAESPLPLFHEAGVWIPSTREWVVTSNRLIAGSDANDKTNQRVEVSAVAFDGGARSLDEHGIIMGNGGTSDGQGGVYLCSQGLGVQGGSLWHLHGKNLEKIEEVVQFAPIQYLKESPVGDVPGYGGLHFNSPNDVVLYKNKWLLFTDPTYGLEQSFRTTSHLDNNIWFAGLDNQDQQQHQLISPLVTEGLVKPNGICLSPDAMILYVTDTGYISGTGDVNDQHPRHVLAYDITLGEKEGQAVVPQVSNPRVLFKFCCKHQGVPDGIKVDVKGNIYVGADDGVRVYTEDGTHLGVLGVEGGVSNLCFGGHDLKDLLVLNETRAIRVRVGIAGVKLSS
jgi:gluconolactonase